MLVSVGQRELPSGVHHSITVGLIIFSALVSSDIILPYILCSLQALVLSINETKSRLLLSTKKLEAIPGDMLRDPQLVYEGFAAFRQRQAAHSHKVGPRT